MARPLSAVWTVARAGVRRRRLQTVSIALVVALATTTLIFGLGLVTRAGSLFDDAFERAAGAHATARFDPAGVSPGQLAATATAPGVTAAAGPFPVATFPAVGGPGRAFSLVVAGRQDPGGPVDRLSVTAGRWVSAPGEVVLSGSPSAGLGLGAVLSSSGRPELTVVGFATSATGGVGGWVTPAQFETVRPEAYQMLYRFDRAADSPEVQRSLARATAGLPMTGNESYLATRQAFQERFQEMIPFVGVFGLLAVAVSVFIVGNVVSGAVVAGFRHIGVMKSLGFTPGQVTSGYVLMVAVPAAAGCVVGVVAGGAVAARTAAGLAGSFQLPSAGGVSALLAVAAGAGVLALVALAALVPASRAGRLPAVQAISAGTVSRAGRGRGPQRRLARTRLPAPVALGLSLPFARPARTALTLAGLCLGVTAVTMGLGLHQTVMRIGLADTEGHTSVKVGVDPGVPEESRPGQEEVTAFARSLPGTAAVMSQGNLTATIPGLPSQMTVEGYLGDYGPFLGDNLVRGRWFAAPGEVVPAEGFLRLHGLDVGDELVLSAGGTETKVRIVGSFAHPDIDRLMLDAATFPRPGLLSMSAAVSVIVEPGLDPAAYVARANAVMPPGMRARISAPDLGNGAVLSTLFLVFSVVICVAAAIGVVNSVVLSTRERSRDLGVLKAIGMAPGQVVLMMLVSMASLGLAGGVAGVPLGVLAHHAVVDYTGGLLGSGMARSWIDVYSWPLLVPLAAAGALLAVVGAWPPSVRAAAMPTASVLRSE